MSRQICAVTLLLFLFCFSCEKEPTTFRVINNCMMINSPDEPYMNGNLYEVIVFIYIGKDIAGQELYMKIPAGGGSSPVTEVPPGTEKLRVSYVPLPEASAKYDDAINFRKWVKWYFVLDPGKNNLIEIYDTTKISSSY